MPHLKKKALSLYLRTGCERQLALNLYSDPERKALGMPRRQTERAGLGLVGKAGYEWQAQKVRELRTVFGDTAVYVNAEMKNQRFASISLEQVLLELAEYSFVVEASYAANTKTFCDGVGISDLCDNRGAPLEIKNAEPDLIQVLPPFVRRPQWESKSDDQRFDGLALQVLPDGGTSRLSSEDSRLRLRVIDVKQSAEPSAHYFAEVVYYSIALAAWLSENSYDDKYVVVAAPAVWPGSYHNSAIMAAKKSAGNEARDATHEELALALEDDIKAAHFDVFSPRLRRFFGEDLPRVLREAWSDLPWHVSYTCSGCEFLGYPWRDKEGNESGDDQHCWKAAEKTNHLSRIAGISKGSAKLLSGVATDVVELADVKSEDPAFDRSPTLRAKRVIYPQRAKSLNAQTSGIIPSSGGDALMPQWPDLHIYVFLDYDLASAITATFGIRAFWMESRPWNEKTDRKKYQFTRNSDPGFQELFLVDEQTPERERDELLKFLRALRRIFADVRRFDEEDLAAGRRGDASKPEQAILSTYQIYLWDEAQRKQLVRVIGRHLGAILGDQSIRELAWLFPPSELLTCPEDASYRSPFTLVSTVVQNTVAVPVPYHYTLLELVKTYKPSTLNPPQVHPLYFEPLSDLIPGERLHEMWKRTKSDSLESMNTVRETTQKKLIALAFVVNRLEKDLQGRLNRAAAPRVIRATKRIVGVTAHAQLWYQFTRLNAALQDLEDHSIRAMPPHEREARFKSAHLLLRLSGEEKTKAFACLRATTPDPLPAINEVEIYTLADGSRDVNIRPPALGFALAPRGTPGFLDRAAYPYVKNYPGRIGGKGSIADVGLTRVSVVGLDRVNGYIALSPWSKYCVQFLESAKMVDFSSDVMLDPVSSDYVTTKLALTLQGIGRPVSATADSSVLRALGIDAPAGTPAPETPSSEFLWRAQALAASRVTRDIVGARQALDSAGIRLNESQWDAWGVALSRRLSLIWGPPGTGKTQTLRAVVAGAVWAAAKWKQPLRVLITASTYAAIDNVLVETFDLLARMLPAKPFSIFRIQSSYSSSSGEVFAAPYKEIKKIAVKTSGAGKDVIDLQSALAGGNKKRKKEQPRITIVAGTPHQLHNLAVATTKSGRARANQTQKMWFDLVVIDEASQLDVSLSTLVVSKAAEGAAFVLAGDDKQLPPIHQASPPEKLDHVVGSVYSYVRHHHGVEPSPLQVNYRSNATLVELTKRAGYDPGLTAYHKDLSLALLSRGFPKEKPGNWPESLLWTPNWVRLLDPKKPAVCFVYNDDVASQANEFEADAVAAALWILHESIDRELAGESSGDGSLRSPTGTRHDSRSFWERGVGVVTPHRAQMAKVVRRLQEIFVEHDPSLIWGAVDTVERFQGQQRDIIVASFGLGDPDLIRLEDDFLFQLNRFNVMTSRARAKLIVLATRTLVEHLSNDVDVLGQSRFLKYFAEMYCSDPVSLTLGHWRAGVEVSKHGVLRQR